MVGIGMETVAARLATFDLAHQPVAKGRSSSAKTRAISWAYERPSPGELAHAGFYFNPTAISPDNTTCFLCERGLDGWEEEDDPITEHLTHSSDCGWATMMAIARASSNPAEIDDPTSDKITDARRATFFSWPHDGKRGWVCKAEKMVEAGWYFCPNEESDDFVSCAYCKLSLDGWEPKDNPFDEHHRRSPECSFFHFALAENKTSKTKRGKKTRSSSKTSRASTQSNNTTLSESQLDLDSDIDQSVLSQSAMGTSKSRKTTKLKGRGRKAKRGEVNEDSRMEIDGDNDQPELPVTKKTRGKKRTSDQISGNEDLDSLPEQPEPVTKKRATRTRSSSAKNAITAPDYTELSESEEQPTRTENKRSKTGTKKRSTSKTRKPSTTSKAKLKSRIPDDAEIDAQLEAELDGAHSDLDEEYIRLNASKSTASSTSRSKPAKAAEIEDDGLQVEHQNKQAKKKASISTDQTRGSSVKPTYINDSMLLLSSDADFEMDNSVFPASHPVKRMQQQQANKTMRTLTQTSMRSGPNLQGNSNAKQVAFDEIEQNGTDTQMSESDAGYESEIHTHEAPSTVRGMTKNIPQEQESDHDDHLHEHFDEHDEDHQDDNHDGHLEDHHEDHQDDHGEGPQETNFQIHTDMTSPRATTQECTPSPSPQSSDAENRPPSTTLATNRNALSPSKPQANGVTIATTPTVSPSKQQLQPNQLSTTDLWVPVDLDDVFLEDPEDKENVNLSGILHAVRGELTTAEKQMTVEEWIMWNAKNGEQKLRNECERVVSMFEREGSRAMRALEGIECCD